MSFRVFLLLSRIKIDRRLVSLNVSKNCSLLLKHRAIFILIMLFLLYQVNLNNIYKNEGLLSSSKLSIYHHDGNWQAEKTMGTV